MTVSRSDPIVNESFVSLSSVAAADKLAIQSSDPYLRHDGFALHLHPVAGRNCWASPISYRHHKVAGRFDVPPMR